MIPAEAIPTPTRSSPTARRTRAVSFQLARGGDGTLTDSAGFGAGDFTIDLTGMDGQHVMQTFPWPANNTAGATLAGDSNFH